MNRMNIYSTVLFFCIFFMACSGSDDIKPENPEQPEKEWDKTRTAKIEFISDLTNKSPYTESNYSVVASFIASKNDRHITILDKANVMFEATRVNWGAKVAVLAEKYPVFVPVSKASTEYIGSSVLSVATVPQMEQIVVAKACRMLPMSVNIKQGLATKVALLSFNEESQINASVNLFKSAQATSIPVVGTVNRNLMPVLKTQLGIVLGADSYNIDIVDNVNVNTEYCVYIFSPPKWKFRDFAETTISGNIKSLMLQVELLK